MAGLLIEGEIYQLGQSIDALAEGFAGFSLSEGKSKKRKLAEMREEVAAAELVVAEAKLKLKKARLEAELLEEPSSSSSSTVVPKKTSAPKKAVPKKTPAPKKVVPKKTPVPKKAPAPKKAAVPKFMRKTPPRVGTLVYRIEKKMERLGLVLKIVNNQAYVGWYDNASIQRVLWRTLRDNTRDSDDVPLKKNQAYRMWNNRDSGVPKISVVVYVGETEDGYDSQVPVVFLERNFYTKTVMQIGPIKVNRGYIFHIATDKDIPMAKP